MDDWFAVQRRPRRGRSAARHQFIMQPAGPPIRALHPYDFIQCLDHQNKLIVHREEHDPVYRGDVPPQESCTWLPKRAASPESDGSDSDTSATSTSAARAASPVERQSSPVTPIRRLVTYSRRDREAAAPRPRRRSRRLHNGVEDGYTREALLELGHTVEAWKNDAPRPVLDRQNYVIAVVAGAPKGQETMWSTLVKMVTRDIVRMFRNADFGDVDRSDARIRFGIGFGEEYAAPHDIANSGLLAHEIQFARSSPQFNLLSDYQNHLYQQFAPEGYADATTKVAELVDRRIVYPAFDRSAFTTTQIDCGNGPSLSYKNYNGSLATMEVLTSFGNYAHQKGGHIIFWEDERVIELPPGASVMFPAGTKRYSFVPVAANEQRFIFRQFCHAGVLRWVEKGGRSDAEFESLASAETIEAWKETSARRGRASIKLFSKLNDLACF